jgi:hypothetical protein
MNAAARGPSSAAARLAALVLLSDRSPGLTPERGGRGAIASQRGGVLLEFALVSLVMYLLVSATITFGAMLHTAQVAQDAARLAARELALTPLPADIAFEEALELTADRIFDPNWLVLDLDAIATAGLGLDEVFAAAPLVNRALRPVLVFEQIAGRRLLRFPGALLQSPSPSPLNAGLTVGVPLVVSRAEDGTETVRWVPVVEELRADPVDPATGSFSAAAAGEDRGLVALRVNVPVQSAAMTSFDPIRDWPPAPNIASAHVANDPGVQTVPGSQPPYGGVLAALPAPESAPTYAGPFGLGTQYALGRAVRPYRRVISGQAIFRREVFE